MHWIVSPLLAITGKDIVILAIGIAIPYLLQNAPAYIANYNKVTSILKTWHVYHWSRFEGQADFRYTVWTIKRRWSGIKLEIRDAETNSTSNSDLYRGKVSFEGRDAIIDAKGRYQDERVLMRLSRPIGHPSHNTSMTGISLAVDYDNNTYSTVKVCVRESLDLEEAKRKIKSVTNLIEAESALRLK